MTREEFIQVLEDNKYYSYKEEGNKIVVTREGSVNLDSLKTLPPGVVFNNRGDVSLESLKTLPSDVEFKNGGDVYLDSLKTLPPEMVFNNGGAVEFSGRRRNIEGISPNRILNKMVEDRLFDRR